MARLNKSEVRRWLAGQKAAQEVIEKERVRSLINRTPEESWAIYQSLTENELAEPRNPAEPSYLLKATRRVFDLYAQKKSRMSLTGDIKSLAFNAGFHSVGITSTEPFTEAERTLLDRRSNGLLEGLPYDPTTIHSRTHPQETLPGSRSIISVALSYLTDDMEHSETSGGPRGSVARFSRGQDYHTILQDRLSILVESIQRRLGHHAEIRSFADTGPLVDRSAAIRAGLGSHGKNTCVYVGEYGSWIVLGELLTDIELEPDPPAPLETCGECDECMKACPTGAICAPYIVDTRLCLIRSHAARGFIPYQLREKMGDRIYGCDTCQSACPRNRDAKPVNIDTFRQSSGLGRNPELIPLLNISPEEFKSRIEPTTAGWIRRTRFRRNIAVVLGNIGDPIAVPALVEALSDTEPLIRGHSAWALGKINTPQARSAIEKALMVEADEAVKKEMHDALTQ